MHREIVPIALDSLLEHAHGRIAAVQQTARRGQYIQVPARVDRTQAHGPVDQFK